MSSQNTQPAPQQSGAENANVIPVDKVSVVIDASQQAEMENALKVINDSSEPWDITEAEAAMLRDYLAADFVPLSPEQTKTLPVRKR